MRDRKSSTTNRQNAVKAIASEVDFVVVIGSNTSSNSKRLVEVAVEAGCESKLFPALEDLQGFDLSPYKRLGITAGASTPDHLVQGMIQWLQGQGYEGPEEFHHVVEDVEFKVPQHFRKDLAKVGITV